MIFDTHSHYLAHRFDTDRDELLASMPHNEVVGIIECATDYDSSIKSLELAQKYPFIWAAVGIHPESLIDKDSSTVCKYHGEFEKELSDIEALLSHPKCVAIGECGLDYHWPVPKQAQIDMFKAHLKLAQKHNKPIIVHDREAHAEMYELLNEFRPSGVLHCYSGSAQDALRIISNGMYIGFGGAVTFKNARRAVQTVSAIPLSKIVLETDCPYMSPEPYRSKRCDSTLIAYTAQQIANIKGISTEEVLNETYKNAKALFNLQLGE